MKRRKYRKVNGEKPVASDDVMFDPALHVMWRHQKGGHGRDPVASIDIPSSHQESTLNAKNLFHFKQLPFLLQPTRDITRLALAISLASHAAAGATTVIVDSPSVSTESTVVPAVNPGGRWTLGFGGAFMSRYEGSRQYTLRPMPMVSYQRGRLNAGTSGVTYNLSSMAGAQFGPRMSLRLGRDQDVSDRLRGMGDIRPGVALGAYGRWRVAPTLTLHAEVAQGMGTTRGAELTLGAMNSFSLGPVDRLQFGASINWANSVYMHEYFGVDPIQAAGSGLGTYAARAGVRNVTANATWIHTFASDHFSAVGLQLKQLTGDAAGSPITEQRGQIGLTASYGMRF